MTKNKVNLPKVETFNPSYELKQLDDGTRDWVGQTQMVEILTLNLDSGTMRVRGKRLDDGKEITHVFDTSLHVFCNEYMIQSKRNGEYCRLF